MKKLIIVATAFLSVAVYATQASPSNKIYRVSSSATDGSTQTQPIYLHLSKEFAAKATSKVSREDSYLMGCSAKGLIPGVYQTGMMVSVKSAKAGLDSLDDFVEFEVEEKTLESLNLIDAGGCKIQNPVIAQRGSLQHFSLKLGQEKTFSTGVDQKSQIWRIERLQ